MPHRKPNRGHWINPLLPLFAFLIIGGLLASVSNKSDTRENNEVLLGSILEDDSSSKEECLYIGAIEIRGCYTENNSLGTSIRTCFDDSTWSEWQSCKEYQLLL